MLCDREIWIKKMQGIKALGKEECPFCKEEEKKIIIKKFNFWQLIYNKYPYKNTKKHILLIPYRHIEHVKELSKEELYELADIEAYIENFYEKENYFSFIRHTIGGKSIRHIHYHYISGVLYSEQLEKALQNH